MGCKSALADKRLIAVVGYSLTMWDVNIRKSDVIYVQARLFFNYVGCKYCIIEIRK